MTVQDLQPRRRPVVRVNNADSLCSIVTRVTSIRRQFDCGNSGSEREKRPSVSRCARLRPGADAVVSLSSQLSRVRGRANCHRIDSLTFWFLLLVAPVRITAKAIERVLG